MRDSRRKYLWMERYITTLYPLIVKLFHHYHFVNIAHDTYIQVPMQIKHLWIDLRISVCYEMGLESLIVINIK